MRSLIATLVFIVFALSACARIPQQQREISSNTTPLPTTQPSIPTPTPTPLPDAELQRQIVEIAKEVNGKAGVFAVVIETGEWAGMNENERFPMQSVVKVPISMTILKLAEEGKLRLDQMVNVQENDMTVTNQRSPIRDANPGGTQMTVEELLKAAISESDGTASDVLQRIAGGAEGVQRYVESLGIIEMKIKYSHKEFGREWAYQYENWATPAATVSMLRTLSPVGAATSREQGLSKGSADLLLRFMMESNNPDNRLLGMLPEETLVAHKTGTGGTQDGVTSATNDVGIITLPDGRHIAIAIYIQDSKPDRAKPSEAIARIARAVFDQWSGVEKSEPVKTANFNERHTLN